MKKTLVIIGIVASSLLSYGQGTVEFYSANLGVLTNTATSQYDHNGNQTGGTSGKTAIAAGGFMYALLVQTYTGTLSVSATNPIGNGWSIATSSGAPITATNGISGPNAGSIFGMGGTAGIAVDGLALPTSGSYTSSGEDYFLVVGWSTSLGNSWLSVSNQLAADNWNASGFFGVSKIGATYAGGAFSLSAQSLFVSSAAVPTPVSAFTLYSVSAVPEPSTFALAALGGASLLLFRRRK